MAEAVLDFGLQIIGEAITDRGVDAPNVVAPLRALISVTHIAEDLLVPTQRAKNLGREFVFRLQIVSERVGIADSRHFESRFGKFRPKLPMMPCKRNVLSEKELTVIAYVAAGRKG